MRSGIILLALTCVVRVTVTAQPLPDAVYNTTATIPYLLQYSSGEYHIWYKTANGNTSALTKPVIFVEGIDFFENDPQLAFNPDDVYRDINAPQAGSPLSRLRSFGYDIVILNFNTSGAYIQQNAFLVVKMIEELNTLKLANGSFEQNVLVGISMGGLVGRYALVYMENQNLSTQTRLFISYDSPQLGANFPIGLQHWSSALLWGIPVEVAEAIGVNTFNSFAAKQMLVYQHEYTTNTIPGTLNPHPEYTLFMQEIGSLNLNGGYPVSSRNIAIANGNKTGGVQSGSSPGTIALLYEVQNSFSGHIALTPANPPVSNPSYIYFHSSPFFLGGEAVNPSEPYCSAPGGYVPWFSILESIMHDNIPGIQTHLFHSDACFIPTTSALGLKNYGLNDNINNNSLHTCATPFDAYYASLNGNQQHTTITTEIANWLLDEITLGNGDLIISSPLNNYNFANNTQNIIFRNTIVENSGTISINKNTSSDYYNRNLGYQALFATSGSTFQVSTAECHPANLTVRNGGNFTIGDNILIPNNNKGELTIRSGSTLTIENNGIVTVNYGGKLIVEAGATLRINPLGKLRVFDQAQVVIKEGANIIYEQNASIELHGDNAQLDIAGTLVLGNSATFKFTFPNSTSGYIKFSRPTYVPYDPSDPDYQIIAGAGSSIELIGANKNDKILEIAQNALWIPDALDHFKFDHGLAEFAGDQGQFPILSVPCPNVTLTTARFIKAPNSNGGNGVWLYGQPVHTIANCTFEELGAGLVAQNYYNIGMLKVQATRFIQCGTGLIVYDKGVILSACRFESCGVGADLNGLTFNSTIYNCKFNDNAETGLRAKGSPVEIVMNSCDAKRNGTAGVDAAGVTMNLACCDLRDNGTYAMILDYDASLRMSPVFNGGNNNLGNNQIPIILNEANQIEISGGRNKLKPDGPSCNGNPNQNCPDVFVGTIQTPCTPYVINAANNEWKGNNNNSTFIWNSQQVTDLPLSVNDVTAVGCTNVPVRFSDPAQQNYVQCSNGPNGPPGGGGPPNQNLSPLNNCVNCNTINTASFTNTPTDSAARTAMHSMDTTLQTGYSDAVGMFNELLMYPLTNETSEDKYVKKASARKMHEALGEGIYRSQINYSSSALSTEAGEVIQVEADEKDKGDQTGDYHRKFFAAMREAEAYRASGKRDVALQKFEDILTWVLPAERPWTEYWVCLTSQELDVLTNVMPKEKFFDVVQECIPLQLSVPALRLVGSDEVEPSEIAADQLDALIYPNPASDVLTVDISTSGESPVTLELYSVTGQLVKSAIITGQTPTQIDVSDLEAGLYLYRLIGEGNETKEGRLAIMH